MCLFSIFTIEMQSLDTTLSDWIEESSGSGLYFSNPLRKQEFLKGFVVLGAFSLILPPDLFLLKLGRNVDHILYGPFSGSVLECCF